MPLVSTAHPWPAETIWEQVFPLLPDFTVEVLPEIDSSNSELMRRARAGHHEPTLLVAERQTAGRGRQGRVWQSQAGDSLTFSISLALRPQDWSGLSLAVGLSLAESLHPDVRLKWPNDLWRLQQKLGGILIEAASQGSESYVVVGVGLNVRKPSANDLRTPATGIESFWKEATAPLVLERVAAPLIRMLLEFKSQGFAPLQQRFSQRDAILGQVIGTSDGLQGVCQGVDADGVLQIDTTHGRVKINSAEVSVRPVNTIQGA